MISEKTLLASARAESFERFLHWHFAILLFEKSASHWAEVNRGLE